MSTALSDITTILHEILRDDGRTFTLSTRFEDLPDWEPTDLISVVVEAECRFNVQFGTAEISRLLTVGDLLNVLELKRHPASTKVSPFQSVS